MDTKYLKYKTKYLNLKNSVLNGGERLGGGTYGDIFYPRLPFYGDLEVIPDNEVCKLFKIRDSECECYIEYMGYQNFIKQLTGDINFLNNNELLRQSEAIRYFLFPINYGLIDYEKIKTMETIYNKTWFEDKQNKIISFISTIRHLKNTYNNYQITFPRSLPIFTDTSFLDIDYMHRSINIFSNIILGIKFLQDRNFVFGDLSQSNIMIHDEVFKIIDFSSVVKFEYALDNFDSMVFLNHLYYHIHPIIIKHVLYKNLKIGFTNDYNEFINDGYLTSKHKEITEKIKNSPFKDFDISIDNGIYMKIFDIIELILIFKFVVNNGSKIEFKNNRLYKPVYDLLSIHYNNSDIIHHENNYKLLKKIDMYSIGIFLLLNYLDFIIRYNDIVIFNQFIKTICFFTLYFYLSEGHIFIFDKNIDDALAEYNILLDMVNSIPIGSKSNYI